MWSWLESSNHKITEMEVTDIIKTTETIMEETVTEVMEETKETEETKEIEETIPELEAADSPSEGESDGTKEAEWEKDLDKKCDKSCNSKYITCKVKRSYLVILVAAYCLNIIFTAYNITKKH